MKNSYGAKLRFLHYCIDQRMTSALAEMELTASQGRILAWIVHRPDPPCAKDIEDAFHLTHPTVSGLLSRLEKKGFLEFRPDEKDHRCKRIHILPKGLDCHYLMHRTIEHNEELLLKDFTQEEREIFSALLDRMIQNMGAGPCCKKQKEESTQHD